jgi:peptidoglycan/xylan/chitin deacetylase (PgdA/CDA1 family)
VDTGSPITGRAAARALGAVDRARPVRDGFTYDLTVRFRPLVLCYHAVSARWDDPLAVDVVTFRRQLRLLLQSGLAPARADDVLANRRRSFHVTFDDAYRNIGAAVPVLEELGIHASVFVCTALAREGRQFRVPELEGRVGDAAEELVTMPWESLRELAARGFEIGSHTVSHPHLTELTEQELRHELVGSREEVEAELGRPCRFLAYPYGANDARVRKAARRAGYLAAYTLRAGWPRADRFALPRADVYRGDGTARFAVKVSPVGRPAMAALTAVRRRRTTALFPARI